MKRRNIQIVLILGIAAIIGIISVQVYFLNNTLNIKEKQINQSINIALRNVVNTLSEYNKTTPPSENPVYQYASDYFIVEINEVIDAGILEHYLISELMSHDITLDFEYAIYDCYNDEMVYGNYVSFDDGKNSRQHEKVLPKYDEYVYYFGVRFPGIRGQVLSDMGIWYFFSFILLFVIVFFGYTLFIILRQKRLTEIQKDFINNMTHEFKTPLTAISLASDVLADPGISEEPGRLKQYSAIVKEQTYLLRRQVEKILQMGEADKEYFKLNKEKINLQASLNSALDDLSSRIELKQVELKTEFLCNNAFIYADKFHFKNVLINIMDNAIKYAGPKPEILLKTECSGKLVHISVIDNGPGIKREYHKKVFKKFFRIPTGNIHNIKGFGLGLSYVKRIADQHRWKITIDSDEGKGTKFTLLISISNRV